MLLWGELHRNQVARLGLLRHELLGLHMRLLSLLRLHRKQFFAAVALDVTWDSTVEARLAWSTSGMLREASSHVLLLHPILLASAKQLLDEDLLLGLSHQFLRVIGEHANGEHASVREVVVAGAVVSVACGSRAALCPRTGDSRWFRLTRFDFRWIKRFYFKTI